MRCQPVFMVAGLPVPQYSLTMSTGWYPSRFIRFVTPMRHLHPCELAPLDALLGGGFPCCALSPLFPVALSGLPMHIDCDSLGCSSRRPAIAFTNRCGRPAVYRGPWVRPRTVVHVYLCLFVYTYLWLIEWGCFNCFIRNSLVVLLESICWERTWYTHVFTYIPTPGITPITKYIPTFAQLHLSAYINIMHVYMYVYIYIYIYTYVCIYIYIYTCMYTDIHTYIYTSMCLYIHKYTYTYTHIYMNN